MVELTLPAARLPRAAVVPGVYVRHAGSTIAYLVDRVWHLTRIDGARRRVERLRLACYRLRAATLPADATVLMLPAPSPTRAAAAARAAPQVRAGACQGLFRLVASAGATVPKSRRRGRPLPAYVPSPAEAVLPEAQRRSVHDAHGHRVRGPLVARDEWADPDDLDVRRRLPRVIKGYRRADPLLVLWRRAPGAPVEVRHLIAVERLRGEWERALAASRVTRADLMTGSGLSGPPPGPTERALIAVRRWQVVLEQFPGERQRALILDVLLARMELYAWAARNGVSERASSGYLAAVLDGLAEFYKITRRDEQYWTVSSKG